MDLVGCSQCRLNGACRLPGPLDLALDAFFNVLSQYTLADVLGQGGIERAQRLGVVAEREARG